MGPSESSSPISLADTLDAVRQTGDPGEPVTASEVAETLECSRRTAYDKLTSLAERGDLRSKKTGARGRVWWRPVADDPVALSGAAELHRVQFEELVESVSNYAIFALDTDGTVVSWNDGAERLKGYDADEIVGEHFRTFYTDEDRDEGVPAANLRLATDQGYTEDEGWRVRADGTRFWANVTITALTDEDGELKGYLKVTRDMTERREQEERLRREKERFETLVQEVEDYAIFMLDPEGYVQSWNSGIERIKGYESEEIVGEHFRTFYTEADRAVRVPERNLAAAARDGRTHDEGWRVRKDGTEFWADVTITALRNDDGTLRGFAKVTRDTTDQHEYEQQILSQRDELDELNQINADIRQIDRALVSATTRDDIERKVCERLAASESYTACWIGEYGPGYEEMHVRAQSGIDERATSAIVAAVADSDVDGPVEGALGARALERGSLEVVREDDEAASTDHPDGDLAGGYESVVLIPLVYDEVEYGVLAVYADEASALDERKTTILSEHGETISHAIAAIEHRERERTLTALHESTRDLLNAANKTEIADVVARTATAELDLAAALVYGFDTTDNELVPLTAQPHGEDLDPDVGGFAPGDDSLIWETFVEGQTTTTGRAADIFPRGEHMRLERAMVVPLGDFGVLAVATTDATTFDPSVRKLVELLGSTAQAAFDRVDSEASLRERDEALQEQNRRLQRLNELNSVVREVDKRLVGATSREEIQRDVCEVLTTVDRFRLAWIGEYDARTNAVEPAAWSGTGRSYLDAASLSGDPTTADPAVTTADTGEITVVSNVADDLRAAPWRKEAFSREFQAVVSVPLTYGDQRYGVLTVYADRPGMFDEMERSVFAELGYTIAHAINTVEMKQALFSEHVTELEVTIPPDVDCVMPRLAQATGATVEYEGIVSSDEAGHRLFFTIRDADGEDVLAELDDSAAVESARLIAEREDGCLFDAVVAGRTIPATLADLNATLQSLTATPDDVRAQIEAPSTTDVRDLIEAFRESYPGTELVARRQRDRPIETPEGFLSRIESSLTERQREVLETAYYGGYFESPRGTTGSDLADALEVSQPTVTTHLRAAQRQLLELVLDRSGAMPAAGDGPSKNP